MDHRSQPAKYSTSCNNSSSIATTHDSSCSLKEGEPCPKLDISAVDAFNRIKFPQVSDRSTWIDFDSLSILISQSDAISTAAAVLETFLPAPKDTKQRHRRARVFLTAYVIFTCPNAILQETPIAQRKPLRAAAKRLLINFESWINSEDAAERPSLTKMRGFWASYVDLFQKWLSIDKKQLLCGMIAHYQELQKIRDTLKQKAYNVAETDDACNELESQLKQLEQKIISIGGTAALQRINEKTASLAPSPVASAPTPPASDDEDKHERSKTSAQDDKERAQHMLNETAVPAVSALTNEQLAHEVVLDPDFTLQRQRPQESVERQVTDIATRAFFDKIAQDMENDDANDTIYELFAEIRDRLSGLVAPSMKSELNEGIDLALIRQQLEQNVFDCDKMIEFVLDVIQRSCASVRDDAVREIRYFTSSSNSSSITVTKLRLIFDLLQDMALDLANLQLRSLRPHLLPIAVEYGRTKFAETMKDQGMTELPKTKTWLGEAVHHLQETASQRNPEGIARDSHLLSRQEVYEEAVTSLIMSPELINTSLCPETLRLDIGRLQEYQNEAQAITIVAALLTLARNFGVPQHCHGDLAQKLFVLLAQYGTTVQHLAAEIHNASTSKKEVKDTGGIIHAMVDKTLSHTDAIYSLLSRRVSTVIKAYISTKRKTTESALQSYGLVHVQEPLEKLCVRFAALVDYNYRIHGHWYEKTIDQLLA